MITGETAKTNNLIRASAVDFNALTIIGCVQLDATPSVPFGSGTDLIIHLCDTGRNTLGQKQKLAVSGLWPESQMQKRPFPFGFSAVWKGALMPFVHIGRSLPPFHPAEKTSEFLHRGRPSRETAVGFSICAIPRICPISRKSPCARPSPPAEQRRGSVPSRRLS